MRSTLARRVNYGMNNAGTRGVRPWRQPQSYETYRSPYGPEYKVRPHIQGINPTNGFNYLMISGAFGVTAGIFALFFFDQVPRVREDIIQKIPWVGGFFVHEVPPEDNPF